MPIFFSNFGFFARCLNGYEMEAVLKKDYEAMSGMIFGDIPSWGDIVSKISEFETKINCQ